LDKRQRNYTLRAQTALSILPEDVVIEPPFTLEFDITRNLLSSANTSTMRIYNLSEERRNQLRKDRFTDTVYRGIQLEAGYGDTKPIIFKGNISQAWSVRQGTNQITTIECFDGGYALVNGQISTQFAKGTNVNAIMEAITKTLPKVDFGAIGDFEGKISRGNTYSGNTADILQQLSGGSLFIDNERVYILNPDEIIAGSIDVISADTGLLGSPVREETQIVFDMLFEPRLTIGQGIQLISVTEPIFNGFYKVVSLKHRGTISEAVSGSATTTVGLWLGPQELRRVN